jgi:phosphoribosylglycinamide formyltransferase-1
MLSGLRKPLRCAILISGSGSTLQSLLEMHHQLDIVLVISNRADSMGLLKAKRFGKSTLVLKNPVDYQKLHEALIHHQIERLVLAGFMKILPAFFVDLWQGRIMNIHPSLLPLYPGLDSARLSWENRSDMGVTLHQVNEKMDEGKIFLQMTSTKAPEGEPVDFAKAELLLRRTEQHLLRELALRWN